MSKVRDEGDGHEMRLSHWNLAPEGNELWWQIWGLRGLSDWVNGRAMAQFHGSAKLFGAMRWSF